MKEERTEFRGLTLEELDALETVIQTMGSVVTDSIISEEMYEGMCQDINSKKELRKDKTLLKHALWGFRLGVIDDNFYKALCKHPEFLDIAIDNKETVLDEIRVDALEEVLEAGCTCCNEANLIFSARITMEMNEKHVNVVDKSSNKSFALKKAPKSLSQYYLRYTDYIRHQLQEYSSI